MPSVSIDWMLVSRSCWQQARSGPWGAATAICRGRVSRTSTGQWTLDADYTGGQNLKPDLFAQDNTYAGLTNGVFGPVCIYTATRTDKFFFDDFRIEAPVPDLTPPAITGVEVIDGQEITVTFSEPIREAEATDPANFFLAPDLGIPALAEWSDAQPAEVRLVWTNSMTTLTSYQLEAYSMTDTAGNTVDTLRVDFPYLNARKPLTSEVVINEIMADPTPAIALPEVEFVEIHNTTNEILDLANLKLTTTSSSGTLPDHLMLPNSFLILTREADASFFSGFGDVLGVPGFPALTNDGSRLRLVGSSGDILDEVNYLDDWHTSTSKRDGGWSLELIDPSRRCDRQGNWSSSINPAGGTPGQINSIYQSMPDTTGPQVATGLARNIKPPDSGF